MHPGNRNSRTISFRRHGTTLRALFMLADAVVAVMVVLAVYGIRFAVVPGRPAPKVFAGVGAGGALRGHVGGHPVCHRAVPAPSALVDRVPGVGHRAGESCTSPW